MIEDKTVVTLNVEFSWLPGAYNSLNLYVGAVAAGYICPPGISGSGSYDARSAWLNYDEAFRTEEEAKDALIAKALATLRAKAPVDTTPGSP